MNKSDNIQKKAAVKKPYQQPELAEFGALTRLTEAGGQGPNSDHGNNMMSQVGGPSI